MGPRVHPAVSRCGEAGDAGRGTNAHAVADAHQRSIGLSRDDLVGGETPAPAVLRTAQRDEAEAMVVGVAGWVAGDDDAATGLQRVPADLPLERPRLAHFGR